MPCQKQEREYHDSRRRQGGSVLDTNPDELGSQVRANQTFRELPRATMLIQLSDLKSVKQSYFNENSNFMASGKASDCGDTRD